MGPGDRGPPRPLGRPTGAPGALLAFSPRRGGVSAAPFDTLNLGRSTADRPEAVAENRPRLLATLVVKPGRLATPGQVHGADVAVAAAPGHPAGSRLLISTHPLIVPARPSAVLTPR